MTTPPTADQVIAGYFQLKAQKEEIVARHKKELEPINEAMFKLQSYLQKMLLDAGAQNMKTTAGTAFLKADASVTVENFADILAFIQTHNRWDMLEQRVSKTVVLEYLEEHKELPPGLKYASNIICHIRKS